MEGVGIVTPRDWVKGTAKHLTMESGSGWPMETDWRRGRWTPKQMTTATGWLKG